MRSQTAVIKRGMGLAAIRREQAAYAIPLGYCLGDRQLNGFHRSGGEPVKTGLLHHVGG